jgi:hypothetical protein
MILFLSGKRDYSLAQKSRLALGHNQSPIRWVLAALTSDEKRLGVKLTIRLHGESRLGMRGAIAPLLLYLHRFHWHNFTSYSSVTLTADYCSFTRFITYVHTCCCHKG